MRVERRDEVCRTCASASHHAGRPVNQRSRSQRQWVQSRKAAELFGGHWLSWSSTEFSRFRFFCVASLVICLCWCVWYRSPRDLDSAPWHRSGLPGWSWELHVPWQCHMRMAVGCRGLFICILGSRFNRELLGHVPAMVDHWQYEPMEWSLSSTSFCQILSLDSRKRRRHMVSGCPKNIPDAH